MEEQEGRGLLSPWRQREEDGEEGKSLGYCSKAEDQSRDTSCRRGPGGDREGEEADRQEVKGEDRREVRGGQREAVL